VSPWRVPGAGESHQRRDGRAGMRASVRAHRKSHPQRRPSDGAPKAPVADGRIAGYVTFGLAERSSAVASPPAMTTIKQEDLIQSVADALQYISYYHPLDYIEALAAAYDAEESPAAKDAIAQILTNSRLCAEGHRPICQDTGIVVAFVRVGMDVRWQGATMSPTDMVNEGVRRAYLDPDNTLRASIVADPAGARTNTRDNTPAVVHFELVPGSTVDVRIAAKGGGSENKSEFVMLNPSDSIVDWVVRTLPTMGAGWCPPGMLGIGIGGSAEKAMLLAKEALMQPIDMHALKKRGPASALEHLRIDIYEAANALGIGAQGLGGLSTVLDVKILDYPTHAASKPVGMIPNCAATRHAHFTLDGSGAARLAPPDLARWPDVHWAPAPTARRIDLDRLTREEVARWKAGDRLLLSGRMLTGRDAAHKRIADLFARGESLPPGVAFTDRVIYYVGPVDPVRDEIVGPAGPTTATRMDKFTEMMLARTGLLAMIGKAERGPVAIEAIRRHRAAYLIAVGGAAYLVSKAIRSSRIVAFADLGMEAIYEFDVSDMPVTVAVDATGSSLHQTGPRAWQQRIGKIPVTAV
jgi:fumarate hydratase class I